jgi:hypothetical protein
MSETIRQKERRAVISYSLVGFAKYLFTIIHMQALSQVSCAMLGQSSFAAYNPAEVQHSYSSFFARIPSQGETRQVVIQSTRFGRINANVQSFAERGIQVQI